MKRWTLSLTLLGLALILAGLLVCASTMHHSGGEIRAAGLLLMSFGAMVIAVPLYIDARRIQAEGQQAAAAARRQGLPNCALCGTAVAGFWCTSHVVNLCPACVPRHHDPARCLYKPLLVSAANKRK